MATILPEAPVNATMSTVAPGVAGVAAAAALAAGARRLFRVRARGGMRFVFLVVCSNSLVGLSIYQGSLLGGHFFPCGRLIVWVSS